MKVKPLRGQSKLVVVMDDQAYFPGDGEGESMHGRGIEVTVTQRAVVDENEFFQNLLDFYNVRQVLVLLSNALINGSNRHNADRKLLAEFLSSKYHDTRHEELLEEEKNKFIVT